MDSFNLEYNINTNIHKHKYKFSKQQSYMQYLIETQTFSQVLFEKNNEVLQ